MTTTSTEKFLPDLTRSLACGILAFVGALAIGGGTVFLISGAIQEAARLDLVFCAAVTCAGIISCAGAVFLSGRPVSEPEGVA